jgi:L-asparaginase
MQIGDDSILKVMVLTTGGTIEKVYHEHDGSLRNVGSPFEQILERLRLPTVRLKLLKVMSKDSLDMTDEDRGIIAAAVAKVPSEFDAILIVHGTDTLNATGEHLCRALPEPSRPIVLTGAMRPFEFRDTDAFQNVFEALLACRLAPPGIYVVMHSKVLRFPGVAKDRNHLTFTKPLPVRP